MRKYKMKIMTARQFIITFVPSALVLLLGAAAIALFHLKIPVMTRDMAATAEVNPLTGILSNLGAFLWCISATICAYVALVLRNVLEKSKFRFLLASALLSAYLLFDDFFMFHEFLGPKYLGWNEKIIYVFLGIAVAAYFISFRKIILRTQFGALFLALLLLTISVFMDGILEPLGLLAKLGDWAFFIEDGFKWMGIASWCSYFVHTSHQFLVSTCELSCNAIQSGVHGTQG